ncbi:MAG: TetR family transcriptional regulator [Zavarzinia sp.]|nr:TetR family transcriptional regulator [Zavarzinia sp.]
MSAEAARPERKSYRRLPPARQRERLIEAALQCLNRHGAEGTTVRHIAAEADLSIGMIRHHFGTKDALLAEAYRHLSAALHEVAERAMTAAGDDPVARLRAYLSAGLRPPVLRVEYVRARFLFWGLSQSNEAVRAVHDDIYAAFEDRVAVLLAAAMPATTAPGLRVARLALILALLKGLWLEWALNPGRGDPVAVLDQIFPLLDPAGR